MSDDRDKPLDEPAGEEQQEPRCGERLAEARREQKISILDVAKKLHLDEPKVRALERNDFDVLGAPVFAKGHLKKYAEIVGVAMEDVLADYHELNRAEALPPIFIGRTKVAREYSFGPWLAALIVMIVAVAVFWWLAVRDTDSVAQEPEPAQSQEPEPAQARESRPAEPRVPGPGSDSSVADDTEVLAAAVPDTEPVAASTDEAPVVESQPEPIEALPEPALQVSSDSSLRMTLSFSGDCWTEIKDADGRQLFFDMGRSGEEVELRGKAPVSMLFGNSDNVSLLVNGENYAIQASNRNTRTARLTVFGR